MHSPFSHMNSYSRVIYEPVHNKLRNVSDSRGNRKSFNMMSKEMKKCYVYVSSTRKLVVCKNAAARALASKVRAAYRALRQLLAKDGQAHGAHIAHAQWLLMAEAGRAKVHP